MTGRLVVLSDLYVSPPGPLSAFRAGADLAALVASCVDPDTTLVFAGNTFDFLAIERPSTLDIPGAPKLFEKLLAAVAATSWGQDLLGALAALLQAGGQCVMMPGNRDAELYHPACRQVLLRHLGMPVHPSFMLYTEDEPFVTEACGLPITIGRGHRFDTWNDVDLNAVRRALSGGARDLSLPLGSRLVTEVLRPFRNATDPQTGKVRFPFMDMVRPDVPGVLLLLYYLDPKLAEARFSKVFGLGIPKLIRPLTRALSKPAPTEGNPLLQTTRHLPIGDAAAMAEAFAEALAAEVSEDQRNAPHATLQRIQQWLEGHDGGAERSSALGSARRLAIRAFVRSIRGEVSPFDPDALSRTDLSMSGPYLSDPEMPGVAIFGYTGAARFQQFGGDRTYINPGTWADQMSVPDVSDEAALSAWIDALERGDIPRERRLTYAEITGGGPRLVTWK